MLIETDEVLTLGDLAKIFRELKEKGWTAGSVTYVRNQVWWEKENY